MIVEQVFVNAAVKPKEVRMGEVYLGVSITKDDLLKINIELSRFGFEILDDLRTQQIEIVKTSLIQIIQKAEVEEHFKLSDYLSKKLNREYSYISRLFSEVEGITIEQFFIMQKIEKVKELLMYEQHTLSEIAWKLGYSSVAHLSTQFKKLTGFTPSQFQKLSNRSRKSLDQITKKSRAKFHN